jgi:hypothetical protein
LANAEGDPLYAARLLGAAAAFWTEHRLKLSPADEAIHARDLAAISERLDSDEFEGAWSDGQHDLPSLLSEFGE